MSQLHKQDQETLLQIARESVQEHLAGRQFRPDPPADGDLARHCGVFVSIHHGADLRGSAGQIEPREPLYRSVAECAVSAALRDPRFAPVQPGELPDIEFEISLLSRAEEVADIRRIEIGVHGLIVSRGNAKGLLLPQMAVQFQWDRERFLAETCREAGLPPTAWKQGATIQCFTAEVFP